METTLCPWCQTEIVWDEEIGPEEECPYCHNELNEYRTISIPLQPDAGQSNSPAEVVAEEEQDAEEDDWQDDDVQTVPAFPSLNQYENSHDLLHYEASVEKVMEEQLEVPECPHCRHYMFLAGTQQVNEQMFIPKEYAAIQAPMLETPFELNMYICSGCFQVQYNLADADRLRIIENLSRNLEE
ncbi:hypothetical protein [Paenibacillus pini]|uniref:Uncharacterized protein n=1 Tax=Paenibacillus pini JCM 16418 TaxID=1236976 RepID=W7YFA8_9BACL|nr:hypothetical protein [Paenibacillus pini]GAF06188.1 hypothetical protein JCM16418_136 [Paenibacillus pini JCM 16418]